MGKNIGRLLQALLLIYILSYVFNFVWESWHCVYLYEGHRYISTMYVNMVTVASAKDALIVLALYFAVALAARNVMWSERAEPRWTLLFVVSGMVVAAAIEYRAVYLIKTWTYSSSMPMLFGIGVSPLLQLSTTGILAIWMTRRLLRK